MIYVDIVKLANVQMGGGDKDEIKYGLVKEQQNYI